MGKFFLVHHNRPSSTVTASLLASQGMALISEIALQFNVPLRASLTVAASGFVAALVAYYKRENILPQRNDET